MDPRQMLDPENVQKAAAQYELSYSLATVGDLSRALTHALRAVELNPGIATYSRYVGELHFRQSQLEEARSWFRQAASEDPDNPEIFDNLATVCRKLGNSEGAFDAASRALTLMPDDALRAFSLAQVLLDALQYEAAAAVMSDFDGDAAEIMKLKIAQAAQEIKTLRDTFLRALHQSPETSIDSSDFVETILKLCDWKVSRDFVARILEIIQANYSEHRPIGISVNNLQAFSVSYEFIAKIARASASAILAELATTSTQSADEWQKPVATARHGERVRIGYIVPIVHFHSLPLLLKRIIERHDRERFEVFGYCYGTVVEDDFSRAYRDAFDRFIDCDSDPNVVAKAIRDDQIDILIDVTGQGVGHCLDVLARRAAPLIVHYLGYSITTGGDFVDYIFTDQIYLQERDIQSGPETPVYLPNTFMAAVPMKISPDVPTRAECGLPETGVVFCNFNQMFKLEPEVFAAWCRVLMAVEGSVLWLGGWNAAAMHNLRREAGAHGVAPERLVFGDIIEHADHLARLAHADLSLDTFHHGGGVTTIDCLWVGVPVLTRRGDTPSSRLGNSILHGAGLDHLVVDSAGEFEALAIELGNDRQKLAALRATWRDQKSTSALFDIDRYVRHLETGYDAIWRNALAGHPPSPVKVENQT